MSEIIKGSLKTAALLLVCVLLALLFEVTHPSGVPADVGNLQVQQEATTK